MTTPAAGTIDQERALAFSRKIVGIMVGGRLSLMISIGHQTGLFDTLARLEPSTSAEVAEAAGLHERYVREWLGAMVTGRIVEYSPEQRTYWLPREHAPALTRAGGVRNLAVGIHATSHLARVEQDVVECFRNGGGVPYSAFGGWTELTSEWTGRVFDATLVQRTLPAVPGIVARLQDGIDVADVACGSGRAVNLMARAFPNSRFVGYDFSEAAISAARAQATAGSLPNARFDLMDVAHFDLASAFDFITSFDGIHDLAAPATVLANIARALRPGGTFLMVDFAASSNLHENMDDPLAPSKFTISTMHCMTISLAQGGAGLGAMWGEQLARQMLGDAGLTVLDVMRIEGDITNSYYVTTRA